MARRLQTLRRNAGSDAALIWRRIAIFLFWLGALVLPVAIAVATAMALLTEDYRAPDCWIGDSGSWITVQEILMLGTMYVIAPVLFISGLLGFGIQRAGVLSFRHLLIVFLSGAALSAACFVVNGNANKAYIDRLYATCGRT
jgi:hypothetical protein